MNRKLLQTLCVMESVGGAYGCKRNLQPAYEGAMKLDEIGGAPTNLWKMQLKCLLFKCVVYHSE